MNRSRAVAGVASVVVVACVLATAAGSSGVPSPSAVAGVLPGHYRLLLTEVGEHGRLHIASYGGRRAEADRYDAPLSVHSFRGSRPPHPYVGDPGVGDRATTVRGHPAFMRTLSDEGLVYARELIWRERPNLTIVVEADLVVSRRTLRRVAEGVRIIGRRAWARLYAQTSGAAQIGRVSKNMRRVRVKRGVVEDRRWRFFALIPPHFPLSRDDRRVSCFELRYRHHRGHGDNCGLTPSWQRIGGEVFTFGAVPRAVRHLLIRPYGGRAFKLRTRTVASRRGPRVRYFAVPLPEHACAVVIRRAKRPHEEGSIAAPIRGRDQRRCAARPPA